MKIFEPTLIKILLNKIMKTKEILLNYFSTNKLNKLNKLNKDNESLKIQVKELYKDNLALNKEVNKLNKDNESLKQEVNELNNFHTYYASYVESVNKIVCDKFNIMFSNTTCTSAFSRSFSTCMSDSITPLQKKLDLQDAHIKELKDQIITTLQVKNLCEKLDILLLKKL